MRRQTTSKLLLACLIILFASSLFSVMPQTQAATIPPEFKEDPYFSKVEIPLPLGESTGGYSYGIETDKGIFWSGTTNKVYRTTNFGSSWATVYDIGVGGGTSAFDHVGDSYFVSGGNRIVSINGGVSWQVQGGAGGIHHWIYNSLIQLPNGTLVKAKWAGHELWASNDAGLTWNLWWNTTTYMIGIGRTHDPDGHSGGLDYNPYQNRIYYSTDSTYGIHERDVWYATYNPTKITEWNLATDNATGVAGYSAANQYISTPSREILSSDDGDHYDIKAIDNGMTSYYTLPVDRVLGAYLEYHYAGGEYSIIYKDGVTYLGMRSAAYAYHGSWQDSIHPYGFWVSIDDGLTWTPIYKKWMSNAVGESYQLYWLYEGDYHLFMGDPADNKLYMMPYLTVDEVKVLKNKYDATVLGSNFTFETVLVNGINSYIPLGKASLTQANVTLIGESHPNYNNNSGWEDGTGYWTVDAPAQNNSAGLAYEGSYVGQWHYDGAPAYFWTWTPTFTVNEGEIWTFSIYVKKFSMSLGGTFFMWMEMGNASYNVRSQLANDTMPITTGWTRYTLSIIAPVWADTLTVKLGTTDIGNQQYIWLDGAMLEKVTPYSRAEKKYDARLPATYTRYAYNTSNPSITFGSQTVSYSGSLAQGASSTTTSISLSPSSGAVPITNVQVSGSGKVKVRVTGTLSWQISGNAVITNTLASGIHVGRRWNNTFTIATTIPDVIALIDWQSQLSSSSYVNDILSLTITASSGVTTTTKIYVGSKGVPKSVSGASSWSYETSTKILTITKLHSSPADIEVSWATTFPSQGSPSLNTIYVALGLASLAFLVSVAIGILALVSGGMSSMDMVTVVIGGFAVSVGLFLVLIITNAIGSL